MIETELPGLDGTNPLGLFAAMGVLSILHGTDSSSTLRWTSAPIPYPLVSGTADMDQLLGLIEADLAAWKDSWIFNCPNSDVKLPAADIREFLLEAKTDGIRSYRLAMALLAEGSLDNSGNAKPSDFHFTAGQQRWLQMASKLCANVTIDQIRSALKGPWLFESNLPSLMWDTADDRVYALSATNPSKDAKHSEAGAEWLAIVGLTSFPVVAGERTLTPGCTGKWKNGTFRWPLWDPPANAPSVRSLIASSAMTKLSTKQLAILGVTHVLQSNIRRSDQGGYGTFSPPVALWQRRQ